MRVWFRGIVGGLVSFALIGGVSLVMIGCEAPTDIVPVVPPGAHIPRTSPDSDPPQAQGEMAAPALPTETQTVKAVEYTPATPTAKGQTKKTAGGVTYETIKEGTGRELKPGQPAQFLYVGTLEDGTVFDQSTRPTNFTIDERMTKGWQEAIPGMKVGEVRKLIVPPKLGYGERGNPPTIPPNATLLFEVELVGILGD
jgi:FKBP-type peptidyl-prolyl cis-trans isomerase